MTEEPVLRVYCVGDFGHPNPNLAILMDRYSRENGNPTCILGLGDNFYPNGVDSIADPTFNTTWRDIYLKYESLCCPWHIVLGNHDYRSNPQSQIDYTNSIYNKDRIWNCPSKNYNFTLGPANFFALDTNGVQGEVRRYFPESKCDLHKYILNLDQELKAADPDKLKIVFGHHPMYTRGRHHSTLGRCLRSDRYMYVLHDRTPTYGRGYDLERVLQENKVDLYLSGHEHVFQYHVNGGVHSFVCGATCEYKFYGGEDPTQPMTWADKSGSTGFLCLDIHVNLNIVAKFIVHSKRDAESEDEEDVPRVLHQVSINRGGTN